MKKKIMIGFFIFSLGFVSLQDSGLLANLRAPLIFHPPPTGNLQKKRGSLMVLSEKLFFQCSELDIKSIMEPCYIRAQYIVWSDTKNQVELQFVLAEGSQKIKAQIAGSPCPVRRKLNPISMYSNGIRSERSMNAVFGGVLPAGRSRIVVEYQQPLGFQEYGHGYFHDGQFDFWLVYDLWPLREWRLAKDFKLFVQIDIPRTRSLWKRMFGPKIGIRFYKQKKSTPLKFGKRKFFYKPKTPLQFSKKQHDSIIHYTKEWGLQFPDQLRFEIGKQE